MHIQDRFGIKLIQLSTRLRLTGIERRAAFIHVLRRRPICRPDSCTNNLSTTSNENVRCDGKEEQMMANAEFETVTIIVAGLKPVKIGIEK
ncbi:hypothetical protein TNCV_5007751 [Trichonephila clavipes]|nr:hypothetical protein TNCV_5007751 [Trichonephila clavipes]